MVANFPTAKPKTNASSTQAAGASMPRLPPTHKLSGSQLERGCLSFSPQTMQKLSDLAVLTVRIGGAQRLHVGTDHVLHPAPTGFGPKAIKPYITAHLVGRDGRKLESEGFSFHSQLPKMELTMSEVTPSSPSLRIIVPNDPCCRRAHRYGMKSLTSS